MGSVNTTRAGQSAKMMDALEGARLVGFSPSGEICAWFGGVGFNVYAATQDWQETTYFTSGALHEYDYGTDYEKRVEAAANRMKSEGFTVIE